MTTISKDVQQRIQDIIAEQNAVVKERSDVIHGVWVANVSNIHLVMCGPGGTGKSLLIRNSVEHIEDSKLFEVALDETSDPGQVFGPPDIKAMVEDGKTRRVPTNMLPEATHAFVDEIFNGNGPVLHSLMPAMNERIFHNNGQPSKIPLRALFAGTNKLNADADLAAFFDRLHLRYVVDYVTGRTAQADMIGQAIARMSVAGRGIATSIATEKTKVTLEELDRAHKESLNLGVSDAVMDTFLDLREELAGQGVRVSDRRAVEGMTAVLGNAWIRGHEEVQVGDLDILANMWWIVQDQIPEVRNTILAATNPGEKAAMDLLDDLDKIRAEMDGAITSGVDDAHKRRIGVQAVRDTDKLVKEAKEQKVKATAAGASTARLDEVIDRAVSLKLKVGKEVFGLNPDDIVNMTEED
jgi:MoxR-like ATPase